jgi:branched-chain amino acid transport system permease protein
MNIERVMSKRFFVLGLPSLILIVLATLPLYAPRYTVILVTSILMYIVITVSWTMFSGPTGYISLASAAFFGVGIYTSAILGRALPLPLVIGIGALSSFCLAILVGAVTLRLKGIYFTIFTFGLSEFIRHFLLFWEIHITHTRGRLVILINSGTVYYVMLGIFVILLLAVFFIRRSRYGLALQSIGQEEEATAHTGVNVVMVKVITFGISALFMGAAGAIMATKWTYIDPYIAFNPIISFLPVLMAIFGGVGHLYGPVIGAAIFTYLEEFLITRFPYYYMLIFGIIMVAAILYLPEGIVGLIKKILKRISGRKHADT